MGADRRDWRDEEDAAVLSDAGRLDPTMIGVTGADTAHLDIVLPPLRTSDDDLDGGVDDDLPLAAATNDASAPGADEPEDDHSEADAGTDDDGATDGEVEAVGDEDVSVDSEPIDVVDPEIPEDTIEVEVHDSPEDDPQEGDTVSDPETDEPGDAGTPEDSATAASTPGADLTPQTASALAARERRRTRTGEIDLHSRRLEDFDSRGEAADLLTEDRLVDPARRVKAEPEGAWQHFVYSITGRRVNLGDGKKARVRKEIDRQIAAPLIGGARFVPVLSRKGGVGKTTVTTILGMALADARDDRVIAIDANPDRGTLADRISSRRPTTVRDLIRRSGSITGFNDISTLVSRDETRLDVVASDADPHMSEAFNDEDYADVARVAAQYYSIVLTDTGTGIVHSVMAATLDFADQLVIVAGLTVDEARLASETLTWLEANGYEDRVRDAIVVLNAGRPGAPMVRADELETHFASRVRTVVRMPYDAHIAAGSALRFRDLQPATRAAARKLAVAVVDGLRQNAAVA